MLDILIVFGFNVKNILFSNKKNIMKPFNICICITIYHNTDYTRDKELLQNNNLNIKYNINIINVII